jgi:hypothetical protein
VRWPPAWELLVRQSSASEDVNTETEEATVLEAVTWRQPVKIQQLRRLRTCINKSNYQSKTRL